MGKQPKSKFTNDDLKAMQSWDLDRKLQLLLQELLNFMPNTLMKSMF